MARNKILSKGDMLIEIGQIYYLQSNASLETVKHPYLILKMITGETKPGLPNYLCCMISSNAKKVNWPYTIPLNQNEGGLKKISYILSRKIVKLNESYLGSFVGKLNMEIVEEALKYIDDKDIY